MNVFQGRFPGADTGADGWVGTCPVDAFEPNGLGLHNSTGNVWEWCRDWFDPGFYGHSPAVDPEGAGVGATHRVMRGGSYLCHESYCNRYRVDARVGEHARQHDRQPRLPSRGRRLGRALRLAGPGAPALAVEEVLRERRVPLRVVDLRPRLAGDGLEARRGGCC